MDAQKEDYSLFLRFIEENAGTGFEQVNTASAVYRDLENRCRTMNQSFHCSDGLQVKILFTGNGLGPMIGLPYGTTASGVSPASFYYAIHPDYKVFYQAGLTKLISLGYLLLEQDRDFILYCRIYPLLDLEGSYNYILFQAYIFKPAGTNRIFDLLVLTNVNSLYNPKMGIYAYLGSDLSQFRYPDPKLLQPVITLSLRERLILDMLAKAKTSTQISESLFLSKHTIDTHRRNILKKTGYPTTASLIKNLTDMGII